MIMGRALKILILAFILSAHSGYACSHCNQDVWSSLQSGNKKFVRNHHYAKERAKLVNSQNPACVVLGCSDSRVPPEIVFSQGLGEMFTVRVAGNVADEVVIDSIEYTITHHDTSLIVVMGHTNCGAVIGAIKHLKANGGAIDKPSPGHLNAVLIPIETAIVQAGINIYAPDALEHSIRANISYVANQLMTQSSAISSAVADGSVTIVGSEYDLKTGKVIKLFKIGSGKN